MVKVAEPEVKYTKSPSLVSKLISKYVDGVPDTVEANVYFLKKIRVVDRYPKVSPPVVKAAEPSHFII